MALITGVLKRSKIWIPLRDASGSTAAGRGRNTRIYEF